MRLKNFAKCSIFVALLFCACAKHYESVNLPHFSQKSFSVKKEQIYLLFLSKDRNLGKKSHAKQNELYHFVLIDTLGVPKVKKDFVNGEFKSVAFLPPNAEFDALFYELLKELAKCQNCKISFKFKGFEVEEL